MDNSSSQPEWKTRLTTVTPFSKYFAMGLVVTLPFLGAYVGASLGSDCEHERVMARASPVRTVASAPVALVTNVVELRDLDPVQGGYNITVRSDHTITVERKRGGVDTKIEVYEFMLYESEYETLLSYFSGEAWSSVTSVSETDTDDMLTTIVFYDQSGVEREVSQVYRSMTPEFEAGYNVLVALAKAPLEDE